jgi:replication-associated recombination protein RarA
MTVARKQGPVNRDRSTGQGLARTRLAESNPFSTRFLCPSKNRFVGVENQTLRSFVDELIGNGLFGQIIGPHGCGKTTLTFEIERMITTARHEHFVFKRKTVGLDRRVRSGPKLNNAFPSHAPGGPNRKTSVLVLDGIERLTWLQRFALIRHCRRGKIGLLVTTHQPIWGLKLQLRLQPLLKNFLTLADRLQQKSQHQVGRARLEQIYRTCGGNIREALMACYDAWESQR